jgi:hypothetical protein
MLTQRACSHSWRKQKCGVGDTCRGTSLPKVARERCGAAQRLPTAPRLAGARVLARRHAAAQLTRGFQSLNMPLGLCFHIHACSS